VRGDDAYSGMGFVLLTGMDDEDTRRQAAAAGADGLIAKPFDRVELLDRLSRLLRR
jgi:DNA-binding response OmpR family regulator